MSTKNYISLFIKCNELDFHFQVLFGDYYPMDNEIEDLIMNSRQYNEIRIIHLLKEWNGLIDKAEEYIKVAIIESKGKDIDAILVELILFEKAISQTKSIVSFHFDKIENQDSESIPIEYFQFKRRFSNYWKRNRHLIEMFRERRSNPFEEEQNEVVLDEVVFKTNKEQIRLLYDLGVIKFLKDSYPSSMQSTNALAKLLASILRQQSTSIQPTLNALLSDSVNKNYPKESSRTKSIIDQLNANERF